MFISILYKIFLTSISFIRKLTFKKVPKMAKFRQKVKTKGVSY